MKRIELNEKFKHKSFNSVGKHTSDNVWNDIVKNVWGKTHDFGLVLIFNTQNNLR